MSVENDQTKNTKEKLNDLDNLHQKLESYFSKDIYDEINKIINFLDSNKNLLLHNDQKKFSNLKTKIDELESSRIYFINKVKTKKDNLIVSIDALISEVNDFGFDKAKFEYDNSKISQYIHQLNEIERNITRINSASDSFKIQDIKDLQKKCNDSNIDNYYFEKILNDLNFEKERLLQLIDANKRDAEFIIINRSFNSLKNNLISFIDKVSLLKEDYSQVEIREINSEFDSLNKVRNDFNKIVDSSKYKSYYPNLLSEISDLFYNLNKNLNEKKDLHKSYIEKLEIEKKALGYYDILNKALEVVSSLNTSITKISETKQISREEILTSNSKLLIITSDSNLETYEANIKPVLSSFSLVEYISDKNSNINESIKRADCVVFNNIHGEDEQNNILGFMSVDKSNAYIYFNDNGVRFNFSGDDFIFTFSNTKVTLYNSIISILRYKNSMEGGN